MAGVGDHSISLCLSGGGLRATLFHLGVIRALRAFDVDGVMALKRVRAIFAVSGGSILAAHMLRNWSRYVGTDEQFEAVCQEVRAFADRDVRNRVLRRWLLTGWMPLSLIARTGWVNWVNPSRAFWLEREYRKFLGNINLSACYLDSAIPDFRFLATNFNTGELCSFSRYDFEVIRRDGAASSTTRHGAGSVKLSYAVAASSSFPPMFPPVLLDPAMLGYPEAAEFSKPIALSDGGVYDNFGIDKLALETSGKRDDLTAVPMDLVVSHAGAPFGAGPDKTYSGMLARNIRATDILMRRVGDASLATAAELGGEKCIVRISQAVDDGTIDVPTQKLLRLVRTDLDRFDAELAGLLVDHGCRVACDGFEKRGWTSRSRPEIGRDPTKVDRLARVAANGAKLKKRTFIIDWPKDFLIIIWWLVSVTAIFGIYSMISQYMQAVEEENAMVARRQVNLNEIETRLNNMGAPFLSGDWQVLGPQLAELLDYVQNLGNQPARAAAASPAPTPAPPRITPDEANRILRPEPLPRLPQEQGHQQLVFIQFAGTITRAQIVALNRSLVAAGWRAQGGSAGGERTPRAANVNEVRYSGDNEPAARELANAINASGLAGNKVEPVRNASIRPDVLEVWISN